MKVEIIPSKKQWYWRIVAKNNKILCHSEKYKRREDALAAVKLIKANAADAPIITKEIA